MAVFQGDPECKDQIYGLHYNETDPLSRETRKLETSSPSHRVASKARPLQIEQAKVNNLLTILKVSCGYIALRARLISLIEVQNLF